MNLPLPPLLKEVAFNGTFVDAYGREVELTPDLLNKAIDGTAQFLAAGGYVRGYSSHFTDDSNDILGDWMAVFSEPRPDGSLSVKGLFTPASDDPSDRARLKKLDTSIVVEEDIDIGNGVKIPLAITRIDLVGQGAVIGTAPFRELFQRFETTRQRAAAMCSRRVLLSAAPKQRKNAMSMNKRLARALGLEVEDAMAEEAIEAMIEEKLGLQDIPEEEKEAAMAKALRAAFMPEEKEEAAAPEAKAACADEKAEDYAEMARAMSAQKKEIEALQGDKLDTLLSRVGDDGQRRQIKGLFSKLRDKAGFELAYESARAQVETIETTTNPLGVAAMSHKAGQPAPRPGAKKPTNDKTPEEEAGDRLIAAARRRGLIKETTNEVQG